MSRFNILCVFLTFSLVVHVSFAARILAVLPLYITSHHQMFRPILTELANRGHQLTVVSPDDETVPANNYRRISVPKIKIWDIIKDIDKDENTTLFTGDTISLYKNQARVWNATLRISDMILKSREFQDFINNDKTKYDLVIYEPFYHESFLVIASKYNAPTVAISTFGSAQFINQFMGNPYETSYVSHEFLELSGKFKFFDRLRNFFWTFVELFERNRYLISEQEDLAKKYAQDETLKSVKETEKNVSLVLVNSHFTINGVRPYVPGIVEIGGIHISEPKNLPENIQRFMDSAKHGVVYFSLGRTVASNAVPQEIVQNLVRVFSGLKQKVLWRWDEETLIGKSDNILIFKWLPQSDVLAHPKMKLFINQGGALSIQEAVSRGVPIVCIPLFGDQFGNCERAKLLGVSENLESRNLTEESIRAAVSKMLEEPSYTESAKRLSVLFKDRPMSAMDTAIYWIEYVIKHNGAPHLSSPAKELTWIEYNNADVILFIGIVIYYVYKILDWMFWNVALRKKIPRDDLKDLIEQHKPKKTKMN